MGWPCPRGFAAKIRENHTNQLGSNPFIMLADWHALCRTPHVSADAWPA